MTKKIKVDGKAGNIAKTIRLSHTKNHLTITTKLKTFKKRYIKYLAKKFLKKNQLRDYLRVISTKRDNYELRYFNMQGMEEEAQQ